MVAIFLCLLIIYRPLTYVELWRSVRLETLRLQRFWSLIYSRWRKGVLPIRVIVYYMFLFHYFGNTWGMYHVWRFLHLQRSTLYHLHLISSSYYSFLLKINHIKLYSKNSSQIFFLFIDLLLLKTSFFYYSLVDDVIILICCHFNNKLRQHVFDLL